MKRRDYFNRCDVCGKFISYSDLQSGAAIHWMTEPDSDLSSETWITRCSEHNPNEALGEKQ